MYNIATIVAILDRFMKYDMINRGMNITPNITELTENTEFNSVSSVFIRCFSVFNLFYPAQITGAYRINPVKKRIYYPKK